MLTLNVNAVKPYVHCLHSELVLVGKRMEVDCCVFVSCFQKHENEEDEASDNKDGDRRDKTESSFVFGQNIKDRAKVGCFQQLL